MAQRYLDMAEAADRLGISVDELKRTIQRGEIRAFADKGTFKLREQDVEEFARQRSLGSGAEVDLGSGAELSLGATSEPLTQSSQSDEIQIGEHLLPDDPSASGARVVSFADSSVGPSDSDVRLVAEEGTAPSDSDVKLAPQEGQKSDSDVKLVESAKASDSDVRLAEPAGVADSAARLEEPAPEPPDSASEGTEAEAVMVSEPDSDFDLSPGGEADTDFEISLEPSSTGEEDLIDLEAEASAGEKEDVVDVTAASPSESGVALNAPADSGISLEEPPSVVSEKTDAGVGDIDSLVGSDFGEDVQKGSSDDISLVPGEPVSPSSLGSDFDIDLSDETQQLPLLEDDSQIIDLEDEAPVDESAATAMAMPAVEEEEGEPGAAEPAVGAFPGVGVPESSEAAVAGMPEAGLATEAAPVVVPRVAGEAPWPAWAVITMAITAVFMAFAGLLMADLVRTMWGWHTESLYSSPLLEWLQGLMF